LRFELESAGNNFSQNWSPKINNTKLVNILSAFILLSVATPAFAYIDPGSGTMLVQAVLALLASTVFYFRNPSQIWHKIRKWLKRFRKP
jgi:hypothetical protein